VAEFREGGACPAEGVSAGLGLKVVEADGDSDGAEAGEALVG